MKTGAAIGAMLACVAIGAGATGWIASWHHPSAQPEQVRQGTAASAARLAPSADLAGAPQVQWPLNMANPLGDSEAVRMKGRQLYLAMNCAGCHGYQGEGNMGPRLSDPYWIYGGTPAAIYRSLDQGHPKGMPAWGKALPPVSLWELTAYLSSMGGGVPPEQAQAALQGDYPGDKGGLRVAPEAAGRGGGDDSDPYDSAPASDLQ